MKWIKAIEQGPSKSGKTNNWTIWTTDGLHYLGKVTWFAHWRKYGFQPSTGTTFEQDCLRDLADFIEQMTQEHRAKKASASQPKEQ